MWMRLIGYPSPTRTHKNLVVKSTILAVMNKMIKILTGFLLLVFFAAVNTSCASSAITTNTPTEIPQMSVTPTSRLEVVLPTETQPAISFTETVTQTPEVDDLSVFTPTSTVENSPTVEITPVEETKKIIEEAIRNAFEIEHEADITLNDEKFPEVFINDPRFLMDSHTLETVRRLTDNPTLESAGYLDYKLAYYGWLINETKARENIKNKAKSEKRELTKEERAILTDNDAPAHTKEGDYRSPLYIHSIDVKDDIAIAVIESGWMNAELTLVLVDGKWYIADCKGLAINF
jgi:hypothetical protein